MRGAISLSQVLVVCVLALYGLCAFGQPRTFSDDFDDSAFTATHLREGLLNEQAGVWQVAEEPVYTTQVEMDFEDPQLRVLKPTGSRFNTVITELDGNFVMAIDDPAGTAVINFDIPVDRVAFLAHADGDKMFHTAVFDAFGNSLEYQPHHAPKLNPDTDWVVFEHPGEIAILHFVASDGALAAIDDLTLDFASQVPPPTPGRRVLIGNEVPFWGVGTATAVLDKDHRYSPDELEVSFSMKLLAADYKPYANPRATGIALMVNPAVDTFNLAQASSAIQAGLTASSNPAEPYRLQLVQIRDGATTVLASMDLPAGFQLLHWHDYEIIVDGNSVTFTMDGVHTIAGVTDLDVPAGYVGFWSGEAAAYDNVSISGTVYDTTPPPRHELYSLIDLGALGDSDEENKSSEALAINAAGQVAGWTQEEDVRHAFLWSMADGMSDLGHLGGGFSEAWGLNNAGHAVGGSSIDGVNTRPFLWADGTMHDLGTLNGASEGWAWDINGFGQVAGTSSDAAFLWTPGLPNGVNGIMTELAALAGGPSSAYAINHIGQAGGESLSDMGVYHAVLWQPATANAPTADVFLVGTLGSRPDTSIGWRTAGPASIHALNSRGWAVGRSRTPTDTATVPVIWRPNDHNGATGRMTPLGTLPGSALSINNYLETVGWMHNAEGEERGFIWDKGHGVRYLDDMLDASGDGWTIDAGQAINGFGWIAGKGRYLDGPDRAVLLVPLTAQLFADPYLEAAVRDALGIPAGEAITEADMAGLSSLDAVNRGIVDLTGLEHAVNLADLSIWSNSFSDLSPLSGLTSLVHLNISHNPNITSIEALSGLVNLIGLGISDTSVADIGPLAGLINLAGLHIWGNAITDISALSGMSALRELNLGGNPISDLSPLAGLTNLETLWLNVTGISDLSPLAGLTHLTYLHLQHNNISDLSPLAGLTNLTYLQLGANAITDVSALSGLENLIELWLDTNAISDISALAALENLSILGVADNLISDISALEYLTALSNLRLDGNRIVDVAPLLNNPGLGPNGARVNLSNNLLAGSACDDLAALQAAGVIVTAQGMCSPIDTGITPPQVTTYRLIDLGVLSGDTASYGLRLNDAGQVTGWSRTGPGAEVAFRWENGQMQGLPLAGLVRTEGWGINEVGHVAGGGQGGAGNHMFLWDGVDTHILGEAAWTWDMNDYGQIAAERGTALLWTPDSPNAVTGSFTDLGTLGGAFSAAESINRFGVVGGRAMTATGDIHAFLWIPDVFYGTTGTMYDLGTLQGGEARVRGINSHGQAAGQVSLGGGVGVPFLWDGVQMHNLGVLDGATSGAAHGINDYMQVVGGSGGSAFIWDVVAGLQNLNDLLDPHTPPGWHLVQARRINNNGWITGVATYNGESRAFLLRPITGDSDGRSFRFGETTDLLNDTFYDGGGDTVSAPHGRAAFTGSLSNNGTRVAFWGIDRATLQSALFSVTVGQPSSWRRHTPFGGASPGTMLPWTPDDSAVLFRGRLIALADEPLDSLPPPHTVHGYSINDPAMTKLPVDNWLITLYPAFNYNLIALPILPNGMEDLSREPVILTNFGPLPNGRPDWPAVRADGSAIAFVDYGSAPGQPDLGSIYVLHNVHAILTAPKVEGTDVSSLAPASLDDPSIAHVRTVETVNMAQTPSFSPDGQLVFFSEDWNTVFGDQDFYNSMADARFDLMVARADGVGIAFRISRVGNQAVPNVGRAGSRSLYMQAPPEDLVGMRLYVAGLESAAPVQGNAVAPPPDAPEGSTALQTTEEQTVADGTGTAVNLGADTVVTFPPGAPQEIQVTTPIQPAEEPELPDDVDALPVLRQFGPAGTTFDPAVAITITYTDEEVAGLAEASLRVFLYNDETGRFDIDMTHAIIERDLVNNRITFLVDHFSVFGLGGSAPVFGDVDGDGAANAVDVQLAINAALGLDIDPLYTPDVNGDGRVNAIDVQLVILAVLGFL